MRANKLETAVCSMHLCSGPPDFFMCMFRDYVYTSGQEREKRPCICSCNDFVFFIFP